MQNLATMLGVEAEQLVAAMLGWIPAMLAALVTGVLLWVVYRAIAKGVQHAMRRSGVDETAIGFVNLLIRYSMLAVAAITVLAQLGVDVGGLLGSLGVLGLTLGFAARDTLSNVISGLFIFWDRPFVIGDLVEVEGHYGRVSAITMRSTRVVTPDGKMLAIPNTTIVNSVIASYTNFPNLRLDIDITIGVNQDIDQVRKLLLDLVAGDERFLAEPHPTVVVTDLGDYNNTVQFRVWLDDEKMHLVTRFALREAAYKTLLAAGVDMPYETVQLAPFELRTA